MSRSGLCQFMVFANRSRLVICGFPRWQGFVETWPERMVDHFLSRVCIACTDRRVGPFLMDLGITSITYLSCKSSFRPLGSWTMRNSTPSVFSNSPSRYGSRCMWPNVVMSPKAHQTSTRDVDRRPPNDRVRYARRVRSLCIAIIWKIGENSKNHIQISGVLAGIALSHKSTGLILKGLNLN